jgi:adenylate cyclase
MLADIDESATTAAITNWLIGPARRSLLPEQIVQQLAERLVEAGVPLWRVRIGQSVANPLIGAWGAVWVRGGQSELYTIARGVLATKAYHGSPFAHVIGTRTSFHHSLENLQPGRDHPVLFELAEGGSTDYLALPIEYGDGSVQVGAFATDRPGGFAARDIAMLEGLAPAISAALEPAAMRHSMESLLEVYLGTGPARRVAKGNFQRGQMTEAEAAVLVTDMRNFTGLSEQLSPDALLDRLGGYFEVVVDSVRAEGGDVLKFIGDGVLSVFPVGNSDRKDVCLRAARSVSRAFGDTGLDGMPFVAAMHVGPVVYGNIGSRDRLDFTVVGPTVNYVSRLEGVAKLLDRRAVCSADVASALPAKMVEEIGRQTLKGFAGPQAVFELRVEPQAQP